MQPGMRATNENPPLSKKSTKMPIRTGRVRLRVLTGWSLELRAFAFLVFLLDFAGLLRSSELQALRADAFGRLDADCSDDVRELLRLEAELDEELPGYSCGVLSFSSSISNPESSSRESGSHHGKMGSPALNGSMSV